MCTISLLTIRPMSSHIGVCLSVFQGSIKQFRSAGKASRREGTQYSNLINGKRNKTESERDRVGPGSDRSGGYLSDHFVW